MILMAYSAEDDFSCALTTSEKAPLLNREGRREGGGEREGERERERRSGLVSAITCTRSDNEEMN